MHFDSTEDFAARLAGVAKWDRTVAALAAGPSLDTGAAHSIGDSLTYWRDTAAALAHETYTGHRRYQTLFAVLDGDLRVELAPQHALAVAVPYSDLSDRERFACPHPQDPSMLTAGQILAVPIDYAWRISPHGDAHVLTVRVTVEGATFHNK